MASLETTKDATKDAEAHSIVSVAEGGTRTLSTSDHLPQQSSFSAGAKCWPFAVMWSAMFSSTLIL